MHCLFVINVCFNMDTSLHAPHDDDDENVDYRGVADAMLSSIVSVAEVNSSSTKAFTVWVRLLVHIPMITIPVEFRVLLTCIDYYLLIELIPRVFYVRIIRRKCELSNHINRCSH